MIKYLPAQILPHCSGDERLGLVYLILSCFHTEFFAESENKP